MQNEFMRMTDAKSLAQKMVFAPLTFQAIRVMLKSGLLKIIDDAGKNGITIAALKEKKILSEYGIDVLIEAALTVNLLVLDEDSQTIFSTKLACAFLYDDMTRINMDFVNDVCYQGAFYLDDSIAKGKPQGLKVFGNWNTVYEGLLELPQKARQSWFAFDHFYSDDAFESVIKIIIAQKPKRLFDIGCNTAKFEIALLKEDFDGQIVLIDLPQQLKKARENLQSANLLSANLEFYSGNVLDEDFVFPKNPDSVLMSQFLDCFSKEQIRVILKKVFNAMSDLSRLYILEPFWDKQRFEAAKLSLVHTSLYFTAIANGNSKMYKFSDMRQYIEDAGLKFVKVHDNIGRHEYSLIECAK